MLPSPELLGSMLFFSPWLAESIGVASWGVTMVVEEVVGRSSADKSMEAGDEQEGEGDECDGEGRGEET